MTKKSVSFEEFTAVNNELVNRFMENNVLIVKAGAEEAHANLFGKDDILAEIRNLGAQLAEVIQPAPVVQQPSMTEADVRRIVREEVASVLGAFMEGFLANKRVEAPVVQPEPAQETIHDIMPNVDQFAEEFFKLSDVVTPKERELLLSDSVEDKPLKKRRMTRHTWAIATDRVQELIAAGKDPFKFLDVQAYGYESTYKWVITQSEGSGRGAWKQFVASVLEVQ